ADLGAPIKPGDSLAAAAAGRRAAQKVADSFNRKEHRTPSATTTGQPRANPYLETPSHGPQGKAKEPRQLIFNQKGKYIAQANALRRQAALEEMKKRIAEQARKAGLDEDRDIEKAFVV